MIRLYTAPTPNGYKISVMLEEIGLPYEVRLVNLLKGEQRDAAYRKINPNGRIPTIVDTEADDFAVFESGAILIYLAEKSGQLLPSGTKARSRVIQWLMFQMGAIGPMMGQANVFFRYLDEKIPLAIDRYQHEGRRLFEVLDRQLQGRDYLCDEYSIADIANWCWVRTWKWSGIDIEGLDELQAWIDRIYERPAVQRGIQIPPRPDKAEIVKTGGSMVMR